MFFRLRAVQSALTGLPNYRMTPQRLPVHRSVLLPETLARLDPRPGETWVDCTLGGGGHAAAIAEKAQASAGSLELGIRPEFLQMVPGGTEGAVSVTISAVEDLGNFKMVEARLGEHANKVKLLEDQEVPAESASLAFPPERTKIYENGRLVE